ncbi:MAG: glycosyltransferase family 39 protein [Alphaproteobacteria bacterium GM202ARS2]|nr:glycosyltransferase family 39 protein [Alphaproteobacteria bacterium GM202ARS2]
MFAFSRINPLNLTPQSFVVFALITHVVVWTSVRLLSEHHLHDDAIQLYFDSAYLQWGYAYSSSHPPLLAWLFHIWHSLIPPSHAGTYLLSQICVIGACLAIWQLSRHILRTPDLACLSVLLMAAILPHSYLTPKFNHNVILLPLWSLAILAFYYALHRNSWRAWTAWSVAILATMLAKYTSLFLVLAMLAVLVCVPAYRHHLRNPRLYVATTSALVLFLPHVFWVIDNEFTSVHYALDRASSTASAYFSTIGTQVRLLLSPFANMAPLVIFWWAAGRPTFISHRRAFFRNNPQHLFLLIITVVPFIALFVLSVLLQWRVRTQWTMPFFLCVPIVLISLTSLTHKALPIHLWRRLATVWLVVTCVLASIHAGEFFLKPYVRSVPHTQQLPTEHLATILHERWHRAFARPVAYVASDVRTSGAVAFYGVDHPTPLRLPLSPPNKQLLRDNGGIVIKRGTSRARTNNLCVSMRGVITLKALWAHDTTYTYAYAFIPPPELGLCPKP